MTTPTVAHPRIRERREQVADERTRSQHRKLIVLGVIVVLVLAGYGIVQSPLLDVDEIRVIGTVRIAPDTVRDASGIERGQRLVGLDLAAAEERIEAVPAIVGVSNDRSWRGLVTFEIVERLPAAQILTEDGALIMAADRTVLEVRELPDPAIPLVSGAMFRTPVGELVPSELADALTVAAALPADLARLTERIQISVDDLEIRLVGGSTVSLGDARLLDDKLGAVRAILDQVQLDCVERIDVRAPVAPALERKCG